MIRISWIVKKGYIEFRPRPYTDFCSYVFMSLIQRIAYYTHVIYLWCSPQGYGYMNRLYESNKNQWYTCNHANPKGNDAFVMKHTLDLLS